MDDKVDYEAEVLEGGHISFPSEVFNSLDLKTGDKLKVTVKKIAAQSTHENSKTNLSLRGIWPQLKQVEDKEIDEVLNQWNTNIQSFE